MHLRSLILIVTSCKMRSSCKDSNGNQQLPLPLLLHLPLPQARRTKTIETAKTSLARLAAVSVHESHFARSSVPSNSACVPDSTQQAPKLTGKPAWDLSSQGAVLIARTTVGASFSVARRTVPEAAIADDPCQSLTSIAHYHSVRYFRPKG